MSNVNFCFTLEWLVYFYNQKKVANIKKGRMERGRMRRATQRRAGVSTGGVAHAGAAAGDLEDDDY